MLIDPLGDSERAGEKLVDHATEKLTAAIRDNFEDLLGYEVVIRVSLQKKL